MEEWEYLEGHKDLYKDVIMDNQPPLTSPDGSSNRNPPERCSRDSTQEGHTIPHHYQSEDLNNYKVGIKNEIKEDDEDGVMEESESLKEHKDLSHDTMVESSRYRNPPERCPRPLYSRDSTQEAHTIPHHHQDGNLKDFNIIVKEEYTEEDEEYGVIEELSEGHEDRYKDIMVQPPNTRTPQKRCPRPLYSRDPTQEGHTIPHHYQMTRTFKEDDTPSEISTGHTIKPSKDHLTSSPGSEMEDEDITRDCVEEKTMSSVMDGELHSVHRLSNPSDSEQPPTVRDGAGIKWEEEFSCPENGESFGSKRIIVHQISHTGKKKNSCSECGRCFTQKSNLIRHLRSHTGEKPFSCLDCAKCFSQKSDLVRHQRSHTGEKPFPCPECGKYFRKKSDLVVHQKAHKGEKPYSCPVCGKRFLHKSVLVKHQRIHTGEKPYSCLECGKVFSEKSCLVIHQRSHTGEKPYSCPECGKCFSRLFCLSAHQKIHTGQKPYSCPECGKCFLHKSDLVVHQRSHTREKPYSCPECGKCYTKKSDLAIHQRSHRGEKPYSCPECGKCFSQKTSHDRHQRMHTGEKPHSCPECGKCFTWKSQFVRHLQSHTGEKPFSCSECGKCFSDKSDLVIHLTEGCRDESNIPEFTSQAS